MDGSFANQVIAQMYLYERKFAALSADFKKSGITVEVLPKHLDEQVAALMVGGFGGVLTKLTPAQAQYIHVNVEGPFKADTYKY
jgi:adenosylhomocysteinase